MKTLVIGLFLLVCNSLSAQEVTLNDLLSLEAKVTKSKLMEDLNKSNVTAPTLPAAKPINEEFIKPIVSEPFTVAVFGVAPNYQAHMNVNGNIITVVKGQTVNGRIVQDIGQYGITMFIPAKSKSKSKQKRTVKKYSTVKQSTTNKLQGTTQFYPIVTL